MGALKRISLWARKHPPYLFLTAYLLIIVAPLVWMGATIAVRSGLLSFSGPPPSGNQVKVFLAFIAGGLATSASFIAALFSWEHNRTEHGRLVLDSTTKDLEIIGEGQARVAGALASMVKLGQPVVAMRVLGPMWSANAVDPYTATWLIDQVLLENRETSAVREAATLLQIHSGSLTDAESHAVSWPGHLHREWNDTLPPYAKQQILKALVRVITSQQKSWWQFNSADTKWFVKVLLGAAKDKESDVSAAANTILHALGAHCPESLAALKGAAGSKAKSKSLPAGDGMWYENFSVEIEIWASRS